jgi:hypothetical protein
MSSGEVSAGTRETANPQPQSSGGGSSMAHVLRIPNFRLLWLGEGISLLAVCRRGSGGGYLSDKLKPT